MKYLYDIPDSFFSLFRSVNRETYMEALLAINEEYEYNNYFLSREVCVQVLSDLYTRQRLSLDKEELETEFDILETPANRILNWLVRTGWLKKLDDYHTMTTNIVIPDYAAVMIEAFDRLTNEQLEDTQVYIQNVYATLFSFQHDPRANLSMLRTALVNTRKLNKALQDMLHNMDKFFARLLEQESYGALLAEHLEGYVEEVVQRKYHILKTSDNFYIYKMDIKKCLKDMRDDDEFITRMGEKEGAGKARNSQGNPASTNVHSETSYDTHRRYDDVLDLIDMIERGFDDIEHRIANMDKEHSKYIRATVSRLNYLLSGETDTKALVVQLLDKMADEEAGEKRISQVAQHMNLSYFEVLSEKSLYKRRRRKNFVSEMQADEETVELSREDVLRLNKIQSRFTKQQIEEFIEERMEEGVLDVRNISIGNDEEFQKLILAYDYSIRKSSKYEGIISEETEIIQGNYRYPGLIFIPRKKGES